MSQPQRSRRHVGFTREGWSFISILVFVVIGSIIRQINLLVLLAAMMIPALLFNWRMAVSLVRRISASHKLPDWIFAGKTAVIELEVQNQSRTFAAWNILLTDQIRRIVPANGYASSKSVDLVVVSIDPAHKTHVSYRCFFAERGVYRIGPVKVTCQYPFGLVRAWFRQLDATELYVAPRLGRLNTQWNKRLGALAVGTASAERRRGWLPDEFFGLRGWQHGDTLRSIHWRSTAKRGQLVVKQYDQPTDRDFALALDLHAEAEEIGPPIERVEEAASFVATVLAHLNYSVQGRMAIAICGHESSLFTNHVPGEFVGSVMQELASMQPGPRPALFENLQEIATKVSPGTPLIVLTTRSASDIQRLTISDQWNARDENWEANVLWIHVGSPEFQALFSPPTAYEFAGMPTDNLLVIAPESSE
jgi:uncharacterized protein (DUF58 family)